MLYVQLFSHEKQTDSFSETVVFAQNQTAVQKEAVTTVQAAPLEWDSHTTYTGGQKVIYENKVYRAKWWTLGEIPSSQEGNPWELTAQTAVENTVQTENKTVPKEKETIVQKPVKKENSFKVVAYYPSWKAEQLYKVDFDTITHVIYSFAIPTIEGTLRPLENPQTAEKLIETAHASGAKALLAIGGWSYNDTPLEQTFCSATDSEEKIKKFGDEILKMCETYGFDGIDMDWEHPRVDGESGIQYEKLMLYLKEKLHSKGKLLTAAVLSGVTADNIVYYDAAAHSDKVLEAVDWIHVMAYDGGEGARHSSYEFCVNSALYWISTRHMPKEKVVLGVPFYGRPSWASYETLLKSNPNADQTDTILYEGMEVFYNGTDTIEKKTKYSMENAGGIMIWEITQDTAEKDKSLLHAVEKAVKNP